MRRGGQAGRRPADRRPQKWTEEWVIPPVSPSPPPPPVCAQLLLFEHAAAGKPGFDLLIVDREMDGGMDGVTLTSLVRTAQHEDR